MTKQDLAHFQEKLEQLRRDLETDLSESSSADESIGPDDAIGRLTRMEAIQAQAVGQEGRRRQEQRLQRVRRALERVASGDYGTCVKCGRQIPGGRLEVMPESLLCVSCAARSR